MWTQSSLAVDKGRMRLNEDGLDLLQSFFHIVPSYSLLMLVVYLLGEVDVIISTPLIFSFALYLPFVSLTFLWT